MTKVLANATVVIILQHISIQSTVYILNLRNVTCQLYLKLRKKQKNNELPNSKGISRKKLQMWWRQEAGMEKRAAWRDDHFAETRHPGIGVSKRCNYSLS